MLSEKYYNSLPEVVAEIKLKPSEYCYYQYLPIMMGDYMDLRIPKNLQWCNRLVGTSFSFLMSSRFDLFRYAYLTVKHYYCNTQSCNRSGWHSDGFGSDDINFIWYDCHPTQFCNQGFLNISSNHELSMLQMQEQACEENIIEYPPNTLLMLNSGVIHRVNDKPFEGLRTFVKLSFSNQIYNLKGNSHNHLFNYNWEMKERSFSRNHPTK